MSKTYKRLPVGAVNFESIREEGYAYVDKTRFIELLEDESNKTLFFTRPRKFGKSLFFSMLSYYYDVCFADKFQSLFGDLYIGKKPTPQHNSQFVLKLDFSGLDTTSQEGFVRSFVSGLRNAVSWFLLAHRSILPDWEELSKEVRNKEAINDILGYAFNAAGKVGKKIFIIIDEYDHFANDFIAMGSAVGMEFYTKNIYANGIVRDFYEALKSNRDIVIDRIILTGVTPIMLDDLTSGFNIAHNLSLKEKYNELLGFTQEEVEWLMDEVGIERDRVKIDIKRMYNGYRFHPNAAQSVYNSSMIVYLLRELLDGGYDREIIIDDNLKMDYSRMRLLLANEERREQLTRATTEGGLLSTVIEKFSLDKLQDVRYFPSLLFYFGLLTIDEQKPLWLRIPNLSIQTCYWEYLDEMLCERNKVSIDTTIQDEAIYQLAFNGNYENFLNYITKEFFGRLSNRDLQRFDEKYVKIMLMSRLLQNKLLMPLSEVENSAGYSDIWLQRGTCTIQKIPNEWLWEIKYIKASDADDEELVKTKLSEALAQLSKYRASAQFTDRTDIRYLAIVFIGKDEYLAEELK